MNGVVLVGDTIRCPELRHEVPLDVPDPFHYVEVAGERHVIVPSLEAGRIEGLGLGLRVHTRIELGWDEIRRRCPRLHDAEAELTVAASRLLGVARASVPGGFPLAHADALRRAGVDVHVDQPLFDERRRVKTAAPLAGIRRAQRANEAALGAALALLRGATERDGALHLDGAVLTVERVKTVIHRAFAEHGCVADDIVVAPGRQAAGGPVMGTGPIAPRVPVVIDLWPRDRASGCFADMTRTVSVGAPVPAVVEWHRLTLAAHAAAAALIRPGTPCRAVFDAACDVFEQAGHATLRTRTPGTALERGFTHGLGHGIGLQVHEAPAIALDRDGAVLREGDVVALEPGLYDPAIGGVRIEDLHLVTADGHELLTDAPYDLVL